jgi:DNA polymerase/3'-5' exonuclease PolX
MNTNVMMRSKAIKLGYVLNEYGLFKDKKMIKVTSEKDIFKYLEIDYLSPDER